MITFLENEKVVIALVDDIEVIIIDFKLPRIRRAACLTEAGGIDRAQEYAEAQVEAIRRARMKHEAKTHE